MSPLAWLKWPRVTLFEFKFFINLQTILIIKSPPKHKKKLFTCSCSQKKKKKTLTQTCRKTIKINKSPTNQLQLDTIKKYYSLPTRALPKIIHELSQTTHTIANSVWRSTLETASTLNWRTLHPGVALEFKNKPSLQRATAFSWCSAATWWTTLTASWLHVTSRDSTWSTCNDLMFGVISRRQ